MLFRQFMYPQQEAMTSLQTGKSPSLKRKITSQSIFV
jgi:hypothetical protein